MKYSSSKAILSVMILFFDIAYAKFTIKISKELSEKIGMQIWQNECGQSIDKLICWNDGEDCASLGIGHFIWYPKKHKTQFTQTFPKLLKYFNDNKVIIPAWLKNSKDCPWSSRQVFYKNFNFSQMQDLKSLLAKTIDLQIKFLVLQSRQELNRLSRKIPIRKRAIINRHLDQLLLTPAGTYAVIDYINFKGLGLDAQEQYNNQSWGLYSVLLEMNLKNAKKDILTEFIEAAIRVLTKRIKNAPKNRDEKRWLEGWKKRLFTYKDFESNLKQQKINAGKLAKP